MLSEENFMKVFMLMKHDRNKYIDFAYSKISKYENNCE